MGANRQLVPAYRMNRHTHNILQLDVLSTVAAAITKVPNSSREPKEPLRSIKA